MFIVYQKTFIFSLLKKLTAILLLALLVFNSIGYRLVISFIQVKQDAAFIGRLDKGDYKENELIEIKVPLNLPYQTNWKEFERVDGEINLNNQVYKYVKCKMYNDTMIFLCVHHETKTIFQQKAKDCIGRINDLPGNENKKADLFKQLLNDYDTVYESADYSFKNKSSEFNLFSNSLLLNLFIPSNGKPPEHFTIKC